MRTLVPVPTDKKNPILEINDLDSLKFYKFRVRAVVDMFKDGHKSRLSDGNWCDPLEVSTSYVFDKNNPGFSAFNANHGAKGRQKTNSLAGQESACEKCKACVI